jgi:preprotein translocase subunit SecA
MFGMKEDDAIQDRMVSKQIEKAQRKVEAHNFDIRKHLLEFDDTANDQRKVIYQQRNELLDSESVAETILDVRRDVVAEMVHRFVPRDSVDEQWDIAGLEKELESEYGLRLDIRFWLDGKQEADSGEVLEYVQENVDRLFREKEAMVGSEVMRALEKHVMLSVLDNAWKEHLASMDYLRQGIYLRGYAQKQPKQEFKREAFELFELMLERVKHEIIQLLARVRVRNENEIQALEEQQQRQAQAQARQLQFQHAEAGGLAAGEPEGAPEPMPMPQATVHRDAPKVGRNDPCPCGSGRKYKHCHGQIT